MGMDLGFDPGYEMEDPGADHRDSVDPCDSFFFRFGSVRLGAMFEDFWYFLVMSMVYHGSLNVPIEHHPTIRYMVYNGYYKVMSNIPKMGHLPTPVI